jgi:hypothetical protein
MSVEPSSERSLIKENILSSKLRLLRNGPYQYVALGFSVSILAHQANPSLFKKISNQFNWPKDHQFLLNSIQFCSKNSINIYLLYKYIEITIF